MSPPRTPSPCGPLAPAPVCPSVASGTTPRVSKPGAADAGFPGHAAAETWRQVRPHQCPRERVGLATSGKHKGRSGPRMHILPVNLHMLEGQARMRGHMESACEREERRPESGPWRSGCLLSAAGHDSHAWAGRGEVRRASFLGTHAQSVKWGRSQPPKSEQLSQPLLFGKAKRFLALLRRWWGRV